MNNDRDGFSGLYFLLQAVCCPAEYKLIVFMQYNTSVLSSYGSLAKSPFGKSGL